MNILLLIINIIIVIGVAIAKKRKQYPEDPFASWDEVWDAEYLFVKLNATNKIAEIDMKDETIFTFSWERVEDSIIIYHPELGIEEPAYIIQNGKFQYEYEEETKVSPIKRVK